ncbi:type II toxin-antitoxin system PemK/MazF family toxin [Puerhibacterium puerhi]|uniref:type II toxin-antitoxin system PemK/MazF family toxin n=1 Tax=Puerhibacterium puerhi TaxID=2692623 RepID=UPI001356B9E5|nr:type II toxin-antitoxin system PemK/MazF family toxin [Puerhibacterium puerhi]
MARRWTDLLWGVARAVLRASSTTSRPSGTAARPRGGAATRPAPARRSGPRPVPAPAAPAPGATGYPGDFTGRFTPTYAPHNDARPDPGEVVWTWVPYEEDHTQGKDRPVLLVGRDGPWLLALQLTSKDHDGDAEQEARDGRQWMDVGTGAWDRQRRPSEVRLNRVIRVAPDAVRREGAMLDEALFRQVVAAVPQAR